LICIIREERKGLQHQELFVDNQAIAKKGILDENCLMEIIGRMVSKIEQNKNMIQRHRRQNESRGNAFL